MKKYFTYSADYGYNTFETEEEARAAAIAKRYDEIEKLNKLGLGYTERHINSGD